MKIRLITFHTPKNYGAVLQAYSLMSYLKHYSDDVEIIDYNTPALREKYPLKPKSKSIKQLIYNLLMYSAYSQKKKKFEKFDAFVTNKLSLTKRYESLDTLISDQLEADVVFTGSDQVFNPSRIEEERKVFYLDFLPSSTKKIAYAASFGVKTIPYEKQDEVKHYLKSFDATSVRESSGIDIVKELSGKSAAEVLDPVFLNDKEFWVNTAAPYREELGDYLFYYRLMSSSESDAAAQKIAKEKNLKLVVMTDGLIKWKADKILRDVGPEEFLYLMNNANYVVTDSFHGVAFSLILEKQFTFSDMNDRTNERGLNLLQKAGIEQLAYAGEKSSDRELNYNEINEPLAKLINISKDYISDSLGGIKLD